MGKESQDTLLRPVARKLPLRTWWGKGAVAQLGGGSERVGFVLLWRVAPPEPTDPLLDAFGNQ